MLAARPEVILIAGLSVERGMSDLVDSFPWASLKDGKVVDIGGGSGHISIFLAKVSFHLCDTKVVP